MKKGWEGAVLKALRARDFRLTVTSVEPVNERYHRVRLQDGGLLAACGMHPTMWIRLWFDKDGKPHQRAYTLVDPDAERGVFELEFAVHDGCAARWALAAKPGDTIDATVHGSSFEVPAPAPRRAWVVGDVASLPAVNSLLDALGGTPATVWLESAHPEETVLPVRSRPGDEVSWVPRAQAGKNLIETVRGGLPADVDPERDLFWVAAEAATTRALTRHLRRERSVPTSRLHGIGYWTAS